MAYDPEKDELDARLEAYDDPNEVGPEKSVIAQVREIVLELIMRGVKTSVGFGRVVEDVCESKGIHTNTGMVARAIKQAKKALHDCAGVAIPKRQVILQLEHQLSVMASEDELIGKIKDPAKRLKARNERLRAIRSTLELISDLQGLKAPTQHVVTINDVLDGLPSELKHKILAADAADLLPMIEAEMGPVKALEVQRVLGLLVSETGK